LKQHEAVIKVMEAKGGIATLGSLYQIVPQMPGCEWKTKTPFASIRRIVQDERYFFKIRPGLWALKSYKDKLPPEILPPKTEPKAKQEEYSHTYYQGLLVELGNMKAYSTYVPNQDKNKLFLGKRLREITTVPDIYRYGYDHIIQEARTIDVIWFNERKMPASHFEVEHSTPIYRSLMKFVELQDFRTDFYIVADDRRKIEFESKLSLSIFANIGTRTRFISYIKLSDWHTKTSEMKCLEKSLNL